MNTHKRGKNLQMSEDEYNALNTQIHSKYFSGGKLTTEEQYIFCDYLRTDLLLQCSICHGEFFIRFFLSRRRPGAFDTFEDRHERYFEGLVREWGTIVATTNHPDPLLKLVAEETRKELNSHKKQHRIITPGFSIGNYQKERFEILAWSKYRYLIVKRTIFEELTNGEYILLLNGQQIVFDYFSLVHIVTRHFGEPMKPYKSGKDHFHEVFYYNNMHSLLSDIFVKVDKSGFYADQLQLEISFRQKGIIYKIFCKEHIFQKKGVPDVKKLRLISFFPVSEKLMLDRLRAEFVERQIDSDLSIFIKLNLQ